MFRVGMLVLLVTPALTAGCSPPANRQYLPPYVPPEKIVDLDSDAFNPKADILFVVDNSGSMGSHQANLAANVGLFTSVFLRRSIVDYNIAVISTDSSSASGPCCGRFNGSIRVVNKQTPNADAVLASNLYVGTNGDPTEKVFDPLIAALSEPTLSTWNAGFLRPEASLIVIPITDAEDQSVLNPEPDLVYKFLLGLKGDKRKVLAFGALVPSGVMDCSRDEYNGFPLRLERFLGLVQPGGGNILNLCATDYGQRLAQFALDIVNQVSSFIPLSRAPVLSSIRVVYGSEEFPRDPERGWSFDPEKNAVLLGPLIDWSTQPAGTIVRVFYSAARSEPR